MYRIAALGSGDILERAGACLAVPRVICLCPLVPTSRRERRSEFCSGLATALLTIGAAKMAISLIDKSQRAAAKIAGIAFPISFAIVVTVNYGVFASLIIRGNAAETARNILAKR